MCSSVVLLEPVNQDYHKEVNNINKLKIVSILLYFFDGSLSKVIALPTIAIAIVVALSRS
jgi:hypothetical protein